MVIDYFAVLPSGKKGALEPHCLTLGTWYQRVNEELFRAIHYGAGIIRIRDKGAELRIPIEFGFGYVLQYLRQFTEAERQSGRKRHVLQRQLDWIGRGLPIELKRSGRISRCGLMMSIACIGNHFFEQSKKQITSSREIENFILVKRK